MSYNYKKIQEVWQKARIVDGYDSDKFRKDTCGAWIAKSEFGNRNSSYGWEIDHVYPVSRGGSDDIINLRAVHWKNNLSKGDDFPYYVSAVQSEGNKNVEVSKQLRVNAKLVNDLSKLYKL